MKTGFILSVLRIVLGVVLFFFLTGLFYYTTYHIRPVYEFLRGAFGVRGIAFTPLIISTAILYLLMLWSGWHERTKRQGEPAHAPDKPKQPVLMEKCPKCGGDLLETASAALIQCFYLLLIFVPGIYLLGIFVFKNPFFSNEKIDASFYRGFLFIASIVIVICACVAFAHWLSGFYRGIKCLSCDTRLRRADIVETYGHLRRRLLVLLFLICFPSLFFQLFMLFHKIFLSPFLDWVTTPAFNWFIYQYLAYGK